MNALKIHNSRFITCQDDTFTIDILGGLDLLQLERMICTLRIAYKTYPPYRTTLDLYNDQQSDKLIRTLCDKWDLKLLDVSGSIHSMITKLESYKLDRLKFPQLKENSFEMSEAEQTAAKNYLSAKNLSKNLQNDLKNIGILGEDANSLILFLSMASHKYQNPFSVLCFAKSGTGKSYLLQKLSSCMPKTSYSFHTQISENALYYFDSNQIDGKVLFIEDLEWTQKMLLPLATLQTQGRLIKTRATKDKDGMLHSTTFEVSGKLCLIACAYAENKYNNLNLPFLSLHLNQSQQQDIDVMEYQKKRKAGLINPQDISKTQRHLQCVIESLQPFSIINPYAPLIQLPEDLPQPRKNLLLLLDFIDVITFFFQYQRQQITDPNTGEIFIKTHPDDIKLAFSLLKDKLLNRADELSNSVREFYNWLEQHLNQAGINQFTALDIRKAKKIHPRTLNRYLKELCFFNYLQITGGNKYREGYRYKITKLWELSGLQSRFEKDLQASLNKIYETDKPKPQIKKQNGKPVQEKENIRENRKIKRIRINDKEKYTLKLLLELEAQQPGRTYQASDFTAITGRSYITEARHLKTLWEQHKLDRIWKQRKYLYVLSPNSTCTEHSRSKTVSQTPLPNSQSL
jgi:hypothetical protein